MNSFRRFFFFSFAVLFSVERIIIIIIIIIIITGRRNKRGATIQKRGATRMSSSLSGSENHYEANRTNLNRMSMGADGQREARV